MGAHTQACLALRRPTTRPGHGAAPHMPSIGRSEPQTVQDSSCASRGSIQVAAKETAKPRPRCNSPCLGPLCLGAPPDPARLLGLVLQRLEPVGARHVDDAPDLPGLDDIGRRTSQRSWSRRHPPQAMAVLFRRLGSRTGIPDIPDIHLGHYPFLWPLAQSQPVPRWLQQLFEHVLVPLLLRQHSAEGLQRAVDLSRGHGTSQRAAGKATLSRGWLRHHTNRVVCARAGGLHCENTKQVPRRPVCIARYALTQHGDCTSYVWLDACGVGTLDTQTHRLTETQTQSDRNTDMHTQNT